MKDCFELIQHDYDHDNSHEDMESLYTCIDDEKETAYFKLGKFLSELPRQHYYQAFVGYGYVVFPWFEIKKVNIF